MVFLSNRPAPWLDRFAVHRSGFLLVVFREHTEIVWTALRVF